MNVIPRWKQLCFSFVTLLIFMSVFSFTSQSTSLSLFVETTLYVGGEGPGNYTSIHDAIVNASSDDRVFVYEGLYKENVFIDKRLILEGEDKNTTIIDGGGLGDVVAVTANDVVIQGFTIMNGGRVSSGISLKQNVAHVVIRHNIIQSNAWDGISLFAASQNRISGNLIISNADGIYLSYGCTYNEILNNMISDNDFYGIFIQSSNNNNNIYTNDFFENGQHVHDASVNVWDDGWHGNYWDDYAERYPYARKLLLKGVWSAPYSIQGGSNVDRYPVINPNVHAQHTRTGLPRVYTRYDEGIPFLLVQIMRRHYQVITALFPFHR
jgi:parallel beta-helix repeat protein